jgi:putative tricarboxylic transport membrane protein
MSSTIALIAGTPPGGGQDRAARALAAAMEEATGLTIAVSNQPGRGGGATWEHVASMSGDAGVLSISSPTLLTNAICDPAEPGIDELTHLALLCTEPLACVVSADSSIRSGGDLVNEIETRPASIRFAIATALGNVNHVAVTIIAAHILGSGSRLDVRAFGSAKTAVDEVVSGRASAAVVSAASVLPGMESGSLRVVAISAPERSSGPLEAVPTWSELGIPCDMGTWRGLVAPPALSAAAVSEWDDVLRATVAHAAWRRSLDLHHWSDTFLPSAEALAFVAGEGRRLRTALTGLGLADG